MQYHTTREVADILHVTQEFIQGEIRAGRMAAARMGRVYRIEATALGNYLQEREVRSESPGRILPGQAPLPGFEDGQLLSVTDG